MQYSFANDITQNFLLLFGTGLIPVDLNNSADSFFATCSEFDGFEYLNLTSTNGTASMYSTFNFPRIKSMKSDINFKRG